MEISRAQCLALWNLASVLPVDASFELVTEPNSYGDIFLTVSADGNPHLPKPKTFKLMKGGGSEEAATVMNAPASDG